MTHFPLIAFVQHIRALAGRRLSVAVFDRQLLERFIDQRDEEAFALLCNGDFTNPLRTAMNNMLRQRFENRSTIGDR
jgi:hypothetical protein